MLNSTSLKFDLYFDLVGKSLMELKLTTSNESQHGVLLEFNV